MGLESDCLVLSLVLNSQLVCPSASDLASRSLDLLFCKMGMTIVPTSWTQRRGFIVASYNETCIMDFINDQG